MAYENLLENPNSSIVGAILAVDFFNDVKFVLVSHVLELNSLRKQHAWV